MEDLKAYIESGILELYLLGDLTRQEKLEVEKMAMQYPEVKAELGHIEDALLAYAQSNAIDPSVGLRDRTLSSIKTSAHYGLPGTVKPIVALKSSFNFYKYAFAASLTILLISIALLINLNSQLKESYDQLAVLQSTNQKFANRANFIDKELKDTRRSLEVYQNPFEYKMITLKGSPKAPEASMMIAFNPKKEEVMIDLSALKMPINDKDHQYQLWAMVDGKPVDLGVFDSSDNRTGMKKMKSITNAQAFAVTLEPRGGSIYPTMEQMMAIGNI